MPSIAELRQEYGLPALPQGIFDPKTKTYENAPEFNVHKWSIYSNAVHDMWDKKNGVDFVRWLQMGSQILKNTFGVIPQNSHWIRFMNAAPNVDFVKGFFSLLTLNDDQKEFFKTLDNKGPLACTFKNQVLDYISQESLANHVTQELKDFKNEYVAIDNYSWILEKGLSCLSDAIWAFLFLFNELAVELAGAMPIFIPFYIIAEFINILNQILGILRIEYLLKPQVQLEVEAYVRWKNPEQNNDLSIRKSKMNEIHTKESISQVMRLYEIDDIKNDWDLALKIYYLIGSTIAIIGFCYLGAGYIFALPIFKFFMLTISLGLKMPYSFYKALLEDEIGQAKNKSKIDIKGPRGDYLVTGETKMQYTKDPNKSPKSEPQNEPKNDMPPLNLNSDESTTTDESIITTEDPHVFLQSSIATPIDPRLYDTDHNK
jgi:hypothetical protein